MMLFANCHLHSTFSDGIYTPRQLVEIAKKVGHKALILTDHDTAAGTYHMQRAAREAGMLSLSGAEITAKAFGITYHLVALDFDTNHPAMRALLKRASSRQFNRTKYLFESGLKRGTLRPGLTWEEVTTSFPENDYLCNNQVFDLMIEKGIYTWEEYPEFFDDNFRSNAEQKKFFETFLTPTPALEEVISIVKAAGGVPIVAHPHAQQDHVEELIAMGIMGFETIHPNLTEEEKVYYDRLCTQRGLYKLGGTDHSSAMGGYAERMPQYDREPSCGYVAEENFMKLYRREFG